MTVLHDKRLRPLFDLHNQLRRMALYDPKRDALICKIRAEQTRMVQVGVTGDQVNNLIHDRLAKFKE